MKSSLDEVIDTFSVISLGPSLLVYKPSAVKIILLFTGMIFCPEGATSSMRYNSPKPVVVFKTVGLFTRSSTSTGIGIGL